nr:MAG TPA: hypothetical protein [Caudoviricetes sp.]
MPRLSRKSKKMISLIIFEFVLICLFVFLNFACHK